MKACWERVMAVIDMTKHAESATGAETGRHSEPIEITPEMIAAGARELVFDSELIRADVTEDILRAALEAGGYTVSEGPET
jgi:hypothetical protein